MPKFYHWPIMICVWKKTLELCSQYWSKILEDNTFDTIDSNLYQLQLLLSWNCKTQILLGFCDIDLLKLSHWPWQISRGMTTIVKICEWNVSSHITYILCDHFVFSMNLTSDIPRPTSIWSNYFLLLCIFQQHYRLKHFWWKVWD